MDNKGSASGIKESSDKIAHEIVIVPTVHADTMLDCDINIGRLFHGLKALGDKCRIEHQTGAETPFLDALGRTPAIQVNFIVPGLVNPCGNLG